MLINLFIYKTKQILSFFLNFKKFENFGKIQMVKKKKSFLKFLIIKLKLPLSLLKTAINHPMVRF